MEFVVSMVAAAGATVTAGSAAAAHAAVAATTAAGATAAAGAAAGVTAAQGLMLAGTAFSALAAVSQGFSESEQLKAQADDIRQNAISDRIQGLRAETEYGKQLVETLARTRVMAAASGVGADTGSAGRTFDQTAREGDAGLSLARTQRQARSGFADLAARRATRMASQARTAGLINAAGTIATGASRFMGAGGP